MSEYIISTMVMIAKNFLGGKYNALFTLKAILLVTKLLYCWSLVGIHIAG